MRIGKELKKHNVALNLVIFAEEGDGKGETLQALLWGRQEQGQQPPRPGELQGSILHKASLTAAPAWHAVYLLCPVQFRAAIH